MMTDRDLMVRLCIILDGVTIATYWEPPLLDAFEGWRADRFLWNRHQAIRSMIRWVAQHDTTGRQRRVHASDPILEQLDAFREANALLARSEAVKLAVYEVLRQPWPVGCAKPQRGTLRTAPAVMQQQPRGRPRLVVNNET